MPDSLGYAKLALLLTVLLTEGPKGGHAGEARQRQNARWEMKRHGKPKEPPTPPIMHHVPFAKRCSVLKALARTQLGRGATTGLSAFDPELVNHVSKGRCLVCVEASRRTTLPPDGDADEVRFTDETPLNATKNTLPNKHVKIWAKCHEELPNDVKYGVVHNIYQLVHSGAWKTPKDVCFFVGTSPYDLEAGNADLAVRWNKDSPWAVPLLTPYLDPVRADVPMHFLWPMHDYYGAPCGVHKTADRPLPMFQMELWGAEGGTQAADWTSKHRGMRPWRDRDNKASISQDLSRRDSRRSRVAICADEDPVFRAAVNVFDTTRNGGDYEPFSPNDQYNLYLEDNFAKDVVPPRGGFRDWLGKLMSTGATLIGPGDFDRQTLSERVLDACPAADMPDFLGKEGPTEERLPCLRRFGWDGGICRAIANAIPGDPTDAHRMALALQTHTALQYDEACVLEYMSSILDGIEYADTPGTSGKINAPSPPKSSKPRSPIQYDPQKVHQARRERSSEKRDGILNEWWVRHGYFEVSCRSLSTMLRYDRMRDEADGNVRFLNRGCSERAYEWFEPNACLPRWRRGRRQVWE